MLFGFFGIINKESINLYTDSKSSIDLAHDPINVGRAGHIATAYHFSRYRIQTKEISLNWNRFLTRNKPLNY